VIPFGFSLHKKDPICRYFLDHEVNVENQIMRNQKQENQLEARYFLDFEIKESYKDQE